MLEKKERKRNRYKTMWFLNILVVIISYFFASINPAIIISKKVLNKDIRELGSKNAGTTNSIRTMGKKWGAIVFVLDLLKVVISYFIILGIFKLFNKQFSSLSSSLYILGSVLGHVAPIYYGFKGGKGVAVYLMSAMLVDAKATLICLAFGVVLILITRWVSLGSVCGTILLVIMSMFMDTNFNTIVIAIATAIVVIKHKSNIQRIFAGKENKLF